MFVCPCGLTFLSQLSFDAHTTYDCGINPDVDERPFLYKVKGCAKRFVWEWQLLRHGKGHVKRVADGEELSSREPAHVFICLFRSFLFIR